LKGKCRDDISIRIELQLSGRGIKQRQLAGLFHANADGINFFTQGRSELRSGDWIDLTAVIVPVGQDDNVADALAARLHERDRLTDGRRHVRPAPPAIGQASSPGRELLLRPIAAEPIRGFIVSLGLIVALQHIALKIWGGEQQAIDAPLPQILSLGEVRISAMRIVVTIVTGVVLLAFFIMLKRSRWGQALRAIAIDRETASTMGVPVHRYVAGMLAIGTALAGLGGALLLSLFPMSPFSGGTYTIKGFAVAIIGGLGSVSGALIAAVLIGLTEAIASGYFSPAWTNAYAFGAMILILLLRPSGLRGTAA